MTNSYMVSKQVYPEFKQKKRRRRRKTKETKLFMMWGEWGRCHAVGLTSMCIIFLPHSEVIVAPS